MADEDPQDLHDYQRESPGQLDLSAKSVEDNEENSHQSQPEQLTYNEIFTPAQIAQRQMIQDMFQNRLAMQQAQTFQVQAQAQAQAQAAQVVQAAQAAQAAQALAQAQAQAQTQSIFQSRQIARQGDYFGNKSFPEPSERDSPSDISEDHKEPDFQNRSPYSQIIKPEPTPTHQMLSPYPLMTTMEELRQNYNSAPSTTSTFSSFYPPFQHFGGYPFRPGVPSFLLAGYAGFNPFLSHPSIPGLSPPNTPLLAHSDKQLVPGTSLLHNPSESPPFPLTTDSAPGIKEIGVFQFPGRNSDQDQDPRSPEVNHHEDQRHDGGPSL